MMLGSKKGGGPSSAHVEEFQNSSGDSHDDTTSHGQFKDAESAIDFQKQKAKWLSLKDDAQAANDGEHNVTIKQAMLDYRYALFWSLLVSMSIIMEGYSQNLINNFFGYDPYAREFGEFRDGQYVIPGPWQSALSCGGQIGAIIGVLVNGIIMKRFGYKKSFILGLIFMNAIIFITFFTKTLGGQMAGQVLIGLPWGAFATLSPAYSVELCPLAFRPYIAAYTNVCFAAGQFISMGALQGLLARNDQWSYRIPYALQWMLPGPLIIAAIWMPESPWWLIRQGKYAECDKTLKRLTAGEQRNKTKQLVAMMIQTDEIEAEAEAGSSYIDCYKGTNLRRTEIACVAFVGQVTCGSQFAYNASYFFRQAGMDAAQAYKIGLVGTAVTFAGTVCSWFLMKAFGRRTIYLTGLVTMSMCLTVIGGVATHEDGNSKAKWVESAFSIIWLLCYSLSVGPGGWTIPAEVGSTRLRSKTICLARISYYLAIIPSLILEQYMMNPGEWNWKGKTAFFWLAWTILTLIWAYFRLPETKGRTFGELDVMFERRLPTREFGSYKVERVYEERDS
ncbi:hypothetical protein KEM56_005798 [Ascosphaera pollenicola]|nr:hypothetical protein KEM56_005798 [Ascosphaera pollenicola]